MAFEIFQSEKSGKYYFRLKAKNGEIILQSEAYEAKAGAENGTASVETHARDESNFEERTAKDGQFYFVLKANNGEIIGKSEMYKSKQGMNNGISSVRENSKGAETKDLT
jgi:uncharacterized protein YegP (UPF0339 family)